MSPIHLLLNRLNAFLFLGSLAVSTPFLAAQEEKNSEILELAPVTVTGTVGPKRIDDRVLPSAVVARDELIQNLDGAIGQILVHEPGVHASAFGAGASRPVIRGLSDQRVRVLESGLDSIDVSDTSPDHAVAIEPFFAESIEIVRGPSSLMYGASAIGGVVNVRDKRIVRSPGERPVEGEIYGAYNDVSDGWEAGALVTANLDNFSFRFSGLERNQDNYDIPGYAESLLSREMFHEHEEEHHDEEHHDEEHDEDHHDDDHRDEGHEEEALAQFNLPDSFVETRSGSASASWFVSPNTRFSMAYTRFDSDYGIPGHAHNHGDEHDHGEDEHDEDGHDEDHGHDEDDDHGDDHDHEHGEEEMVFIALEQEKFGVEFEHQFQGEFLESLVLKFNTGDYLHEEIEGETSGTSFSRESYELRGELLHRFGDNQLGVAGFQVSDNDMVFDGPEAFAPSSSTFNAAFFLLEEWNIGATRFEAGGRLEYQSLEGDTFADQDDWTTSLSLGALHPIHDSLRLGFSATRAERSPTAIERYADGAHLATRQFVSGDADLEKEVATGFSATAYFQQGRVTGHMALFYNDFDGFIFADPTGMEEDGFPVYQYRGVDAALYGFEAQVSWSAFVRDQSGLLIHALTDMTRGTTDNDGDLPLMPPVRLGTGFTYYNGPWEVDSRYTHAFKQDRTATNELETPAYDAWEASIAYQVNLGDQSLRFRLSGLNLLDEEIRYHTSTLKDLAPLPGRNIRLSASLLF